MPWILPVLDGTLRGLDDNSFDNFMTANGNPAFFMTGDGHRAPPFQWTMNSPVKKLYFQNLMFTDRLIAHVELQQEQVTESSVPPELFPLYSQGKIFGWEPTIYKHLQPVMEKCLELTSSYSLDPGKILPDVVALDREFLRIRGLIWEIGTPQELYDAPDKSLTFRTYCQNVCSNSFPRDNAKETAYTEFLMGYYNKCMELRTSAGVQQAIGNNIQSIINRYPAAVHLITCGDAHILYNPLYNYITLPPGTSGIVDVAAH